MTRHELRMLQDFLLESVEVVDFPSTDSTFRYIPTSAVGKMVDFIDTREYAQKVRISEDCDLDDLVTVLSDGLAMECGFESVDYSKDDYDEARFELLSLNVHPDEITHELIEAQMIRMGMRFELVEVDIHEHHRLTLQMFANGFRMQAESYMKQYDCTKMHAIISMMEEGDFYDYNAILQYAVFGEVIYG